MADERLKEHPPVPPGNVSEIMRACLESLAVRGLGKWISIGGAFGLSYYHQYRTTHDIDALWMEEAHDDARLLVIRCIEEELQKFGVVRTRAWGDVVSVDVVSGDARTQSFSFQIANRTTRLQASLDAPWPPGIYLDSMADLVASKMVALIERGAPRDFLDIYTFCLEGRVRPDQCWHLWREREVRGSGTCDPDRARTAIQTHLSRIAISRPLDVIGNTEERAAAERVRNWFFKDFLDALRD